MLCLGHVRYPHVAAGYRKLPIMNARAVNVAILLLLVLELASGLGSFLFGEPDSRWLFWLHRAGGLSLVLLLAWKASMRPAPTTAAALAVAPGSRRSRASSS